MDSFLWSYFHRSFPSREDKLTKEDVTPYLSRLDAWECLFDYYDVIQCYGTDPIYPMLAKKNNYVAFEHGTLRTFCFDDNSLCRLVSLGYRQSSHTFVTNGDCLAYAQKLGVERFSPMIHPLDSELHRSYGEQDKGALKKALSCDVLLYCPIRHDWEVKGTDQHLHAMKALVQQCPEYRIKLILANWGGDLDKSKQLIKEYGLEENIVWEEPATRKRMIKLMKASDVVLDQMALPHFGGTAPQALASGVPVIMSYVPTSTEWMVEEPAPILAAHSIEEIVQQIKKVVQDEEFKAALKQKAHDWVEKYHSETVLFQKQIPIYATMLSMG